MITAYLGLGSNMGNREAYLRQAVTLLSQQAEIEVECVSSIYESEPVGFTDQAAFLNAVVQVRTTLAALDLLDSCLRVEAQLGRTRDIRWGPRTIDVDILLYGQQFISLSRLTVPHPRLQERLFALIPLQELAPGLAWHGQSVEEYISALPKSPTVRLYSHWL